MVGRELLVEQPRRVARFDVVAERLEPPSRFGDRGDTVGVDRYTDRLDQMRCSRCAGRVTTQMDIDPEGFVEQAADKLGILDLRVKGISSGSKTSSRSSRPSPVRGAARCRATDQSSAWARDETPH